ncbi:MAG TPA: hypothetical protein VNA25_19540 [Phycisphaerae bacterium]|nr:hypothetical protein [Phycisphaerae bacterium]
MDEDGVTVIQIAWEDLGVLPDRSDWASRLEDLGLPGWIMNMTVLAVSDFLEPLPKKRSATRRGRWKRRQRELDRWSAHRWLFNDYPDEFNFSAVCRILGLDPKAARMKILMLRNEGFLMQRGGRGESVVQCATISPGQSGPEREE